MENQEEMKQNIPALLNSINLFLRVCHNVDKETYACIKKALVCLVETPQTGITDEVINNYYFLLGITKLETFLKMENIRSNCSVDVHRKKLIELTHRLLEELQDKDLFICKELYKYFEIYTNYTSSASQKNEAGVLLEYYLTSYYGCLEDEDNLYKNWEKK